MDEVEEHIREHRLETTKDFLGIVFSMDARAAYDHFSKHKHDISFFLHERFRGIPLNLQTGNTYGLFFEQAIKDFDIRDANSWFSAQPEGVTGFIRGYYAQAGCRGFSSDADYAKKARQDFPEMGDILDDLEIFHRQEDSRRILYSML